MDFFVYSGISSQCLNTILLTFNTFDNNMIDNNLNLNIPIKSPSDLDEVVENFNNLIHEAGFVSTPNVQTSNNCHNTALTTEIREMTRTKRVLRISQTSRNPTDKSY